jgi:hypothetical protein
MVKGKFQPISDLRLSLRFVCHQCLDFLHRTFSRFQLRHGRIVEVHFREEGLEVWVGHEGWAIALCIYWPRLYDRTDGDYTTAIY